MAKTPGHGRGTDGAREATAPRDWTTARDRYVTGNEGHRAIAAALGVSSTSLSAAAKREDWAAAREAFRARASKAVETAGVKARVARYPIQAEADIDGQAHDVAKRLGRLARGLLKALVKDGKPLLSIDDAPKLKALVEAIEKAHRLARMTAHLTPEPAPQGESDGDGVIRIKRRNERGEVVEVEIGDRDRTGPDRQAADEDPVGLP